MLLVYTARSRPNWDVSYGIVSLMTEAASSSITYRFVLHVNTDIQIKTARTNTINSPARVLFVGTNSLQCNLMSSSRPTPPVKKVNSRTLSSKLHGDLFRDDISNGSGVNRVERHPDWLRDRQKTHKRTQLKTILPTARCAVGNEVCRLHSIRAWSCAQDNKNAVLSRRWPHNAPHNMGALKIFGTPCSYFPPNFSWAVVLTDRINVHTKFEVRSFTRSWVNRG